MDQQQRRVGLDVGAVGPDADSATAETAKELEGHEISVVIGCLRVTSPKPRSFAKTAFIRQTEFKGCRSPGDRVPSQSTMDRTGYRHEMCDPVICRCFPLLACTINATAQRTMYAASGKTPASASTRAPGDRRALPSRRPEHEEGSFSHGAGDKASYQVKINPRPNVKPTTTIALEQQTPPK